MSETNIHDKAMVSKGAQLGQGVTVGPNCIIEDGAIIGDHAVLHANSYIAGSVNLGEKVEVYPFAVLGMAPQDFKYMGEETRLIIGKNTIIREHVTMHPGTNAGKGETRIGHDGYFMVASHVAHDCVVGNHVVFANNAALAGFVTVGDYCILGGLSAVHQFSRIGDYSFIGSMAMVTGDVIPYGSVYGNHAHLAGLNLVGLKRRGIARSTIHDLRSAYRLLFADEGAFDERVEDVARTFASSDEVMKVVAFIRAASQRSLCMPDVR